MRGKIVKGIAGFYYVWCEDDKLYECKAKGSFRKEGIKPLVGDNVTVCVLDEEKHLGNLEEILPRKNGLIRPAVANVDQALIVFAMANPMPNLNLLDRFLLMMEWQNVETIICFSKQDMVSDEEEKHFLSIYEKCANEVLTISNTENMGIDKVKQCLEGKTTVLAGPSGVGKSSLLNRLCPQAASVTGSVSEKIGRGRHTTRHSEIYSLGNQTFLFDTPGFSSLKPPEVEKEELRRYFTEFLPYEGQCKYWGCTHIHEPGCMVKEARKRGEIGETRYENYVQIFNELAECERRGNWRNKK